MSLLKRYIIIILRNIQYNIAFTIMVNICYQTIPCTFILVFINHVEVEIIGQLTRKSSVRIAQLKKQLTTVVVVPDEIKNAVTVEIALIYAFVICDAGIKCAAIDKLTLEQIATLIVENAVSSITEYHKIS